MRTIVLLAGAKGSGKSTTANTISSLQPYKWRMLAFADRLKLIVSAMIASDYDYVDQHKDQLIPHLGKTIGQLLQCTGDGIRNHVDQDFFVKALIEEIEASECEKFIVHDLRFRNELEKIKAHFENDKVVTVKLYGREKTDSRDRNHISERDLDSYTDYDLLINTSFMSPNMVASVIVKDI